MDVLIYETGGEKTVVAVGNLTVRMDGLDIDEVDVANDPMSGEPPFYTLSDLPCATCTVATVDETTLSNRPVDFHIKSKYLIDELGVFTLNPDYGN